MEVELKDMQPQLIEKSKEVDQQAAVVEKETIEAEKVREVVDAEAAVAQAAADKTEAIKQDCEKDLEKAMPALRAAAKALENITKDDITLLKTIKKFNADVDMVFSAVCILMGQAPDSKMDPATQKRIIDYETPAKKMIGQLDFLEQVQNYPKEEMGEKLI